MKRSDIPLLPNAPVITDVSKMKEVKFQFPLLLEGGSNLHLLLLYQPGNLRAWELTVSPGQRMIQTEAGHRQVGEINSQFSICRRPP